jgi:two-component system, OmpR family, response regulator
LKILIVEDDRLLANGLRMALQSTGYKVESASDGEDADLLMSTNTYDLVVLDLGLPGIDGLEVLSRLRKRYCTTPVLILSARNDLKDLVNGLNSGANDYLTKPFELEELQARIRALLRKEHWGNMNEVRYGDLSFDTVERKFFARERELELLPRELTVLELLFKRAGRTVKKQTIIDELTELDLELSDNALDIMIYRLRKKIEDSKCAIRTIRGMGYILETPKATENMN